MKKTAFLLPLLLSACFPVALPTSNPFDDKPNIYGAWRLAEINRKVPADLNTVFTFNNTDRGFRIASECHKASGEYTVSDGQALYFGRLQSENVCTVDIPERNLIQSLENVRSYRFNQRQLELLDQQGNPVIVGKRLRGERSVGPSDLGDKTYFSDARRH